MPNVHNDDSICKIMKFFFISFYFSQSGTPAFTLTPSTQRA
jgi:hypothetical protein